jgi:hypothetical protein
MSNINNEAFIFARNKLNRTDCAWMSYIK